MTTHFLSAKFFRNFKAVFTLLLLVVLFSDCTKGVIEFIPRHKFPDLSKKYSSEGFTKQELEANLKTDVKGYFLDLVSDVKPTEIARVGSDKKSIVFKKLGKFTATVAFVNATGKGFKFVNASFEILRGTAETLTFQKVSKLFTSGGKFTTADILGGVRGTKTGYTITNIAELNPSNLASVTSSKELNFRGRIGSFTATIILEHSTKADATITNCAFEITAGAAPSLTFTKRSKAFSSGGKFTTAEILAGVQGTKAGYTVKNITALNPASLATVSSSKELNFRGRIGSFTATIILEHSTKADATITNCAFEITAGAAPSLTFTKRSKAFSSGGKFTTAEILAGVQGNKSGYTVKDITTLNPANLTTVSSSKELNFRGRIGSFTATIILEHSTKADATITNCAFEITAGAAPSLTFTKRSKAFSSGGKFTTADILAGVQGTKAGYTVKNITALNPASLATVSSSKELNFRGRIGSFTATIILEHSTKADATITNCAFEITSAAARGLSFTKVTKVFTSGGQFTKAEILAGVQGNKTGYTLKSITNLTPSNVAVAVSAKPTFLILFTKGGSFTATLTLEHPTKAGAVITGAEFEIAKMPAPTLTFQKVYKQFTGSGKFATAEILAGVQGTKAGYTVKSITSLNPSNLATSSATNDLNFQNKIGRFTATITLQHPTKKDAVITGCAFEITRADAERLTFQGVDKPFTSGGAFSTADIWAGVQGNKSGYTIKNISNISPTGIVYLLGSKPNFTLYMLKKGRVTATITLEHPTKKEVNITASSFGVGVWDKTFGGSSDDSANAIVQTTDGGYAVAGYTNSKGAGGYDMWVIKLDASGNKTWDKTFGGSSYDSANSIVQTTDGGYVVAGYTKSKGAGGSDMWVVKLDASGNKTWDKTFGGSSYDSANSIVQTADGGYAVAGYTK